jgi:hypothetical protein
MHTLKHIEKSWAPMALFIGASWLIGALVIALG